MKLSPERNWKSLLRKLRSSAGLRHGLVMSAAMILAGALDYVVNVLAGRWLVPVEYGIFVSIAAILQVVLYVSIAIRNVVAFYSAELSARVDSRVQLGVFVRRAWRWGWQWGLVAMAVMAAISPFLARLLQLPNIWA